MTYYLGQLLITEGESETYTYVRFKDENPLTRMNAIASRWFGGESNLIDITEDEGNLYECDNKLIEAVKWQEISKEVYKAITLIPED